MQLDWEPRDRSGRSMRRLALAFLIGAGLFLASLGLMMLLEVAKRVLR
jgi:hypothetical protein